MTTNNNGLFCKFCGDPLKDRQKKCCSKNDCHIKMKSGHSKTFKGKPENKHYYRDYSRKRRAGLIKADERIVKKREEYLSKDVPDTLKHSNKKCTLCKKRKVMKGNRFLCRTCFTQNANSFSEDFVYMGSADDFRSTNKCNGGGKHERCIN